MKEHKAPEIAQVFTTLLVVSTTQAILSWRLHFWFINLLPSIPAHGLPQRRKGCPAVFGNLQLQSDPEGHYEQLVWFRAVQTSTELAREPGTTTSCLTSLLLIPCCKQQNLRTAEILSYHMMWWNRSVLLHGGLKHGNMISFKTNVLCVGYCNTVVKCLGFIFLLLNWLILALSSVHMEIDVIWK